MQENRITAGRGLKMMFNAQIMSVLALVPALIGLFAALSQDNYKPYPTNGGIAAVFAVIGGLIVIVAAVMSIVGLVRCRKAHDYYLYALCVMIAATVLGVLLERLIGGKDLIAGIGRIVIAYLVCTATDQLAALSGEVTYRPTGALTWKLIAVGEIASLLPFLNIVGSIVDIAANVFYMVFLYRAGNFLLCVPVPDRPAEANDPLN